MLDLTRSINFFSMLFVELRFSHARIFFFPVQKAVHRVGPRPCSSRNTGSDKQSQVHLTANQLDCSHKPARLQKKWLLGIQIRILRQCRQFSAEQWFLEGSKLRFWIALDDTVAVHSWNVFRNYSLFKSWLGLVIVRTSGESVSRISKILQRRNLLLNAQLLKYNIYNNITLNCKSVHLSMIIVFNARAIQQYIHRFVELNGFLDF